MCVCACVYISVTVYLLNKVRGLSSPPPFPFAFTSLTTSPVLFDIPTQLCTFPCLIYIPLKHTSIKVAPFFFSSFFPSCPLVSSCCCRIAGSSYIPYWCSFKKKKKKVNVYVVVVHGENKKLLCQKKWSQYNLLRKTIQKKNQNMSTIGSCWAWRKQYQIVFPYWNEFKCQ